jgi:ferredoxin
MPKVIVEASLCTGCGLCAALCPEVFVMEDDGLSHVKEEGIEKSNCDLKKVAEDCPVAAIKVS